jgi:hypothetical protein
LELYHIFMYSIQILVSFDLVEATIQRIFFATYLIIMRVRLECHSFIHAELGLGGNHDQGRSPDMHHDGGRRANPTSALECAPRAGQVGSNGLTPGSGFRRMKANDQAPFS